MSAVKAESAGHLCPSHPATPRASLLGVVNEHGTVDILPRPIPLNDAFLRDGIDLERRFRFTGACIQEKCRQWHDGGCRVGKMVAAIENPMPSQRLKPCAIRGSCRWFSQDGAAACHNCQLVITDNRAVSQ